MTQKHTKSVYTIPAGVPFAKALAGRLLEETRGKPEELSHYRIFLPTRRACRTLREAFLQLSQGKPLLLPHMQPIGDLDEEELSLALFQGRDEQAILDLPPAISPLKRQLLLARTIGSVPDYSHGPGQALALANALGHLLDQIIIEELDIGALDQIVPEEFADHWQITLDFLKIISEHWPKILEEQGAIDSADRRNRLIKALAGHWQRNPPSGPIIAAGSTGSIPATAMLLSTIAGLEQGRVVLPGLDQMMDEQSWDAIDESHPQYGLKHLLEHMEVARENVKLWHNCGESATQPRQRLGYELMRPADTAGEWENLATSKESAGVLQEALEGLQIFECDHESEEAGLIALKMREILEDPTRTAALVTPDRKLARRVATTCQRWGITLDDSAGQNLSDSPIGIFLRITAEACLSNMAPTSLLALLKHEFCTLGHKNETFRKIVDKLEILTLRGLRPASGLEGIRQRLEELNDKEPDKLLDQIDPVLNRFSALLNNQTLQSFSDLLAVHVETLEALAQGEKASGSTRLWSGESGEKAASFLSELQNHAHLLPPLSGQNYVDILQQLMKTETVRPLYGTHPRLMILGQLEARLIDADLIIMAGLNEGTWPSDPGHDPWMSRPMRKDFGLPAGERAVGLAAHDFTQGFCAQHVVLTRSKRVDGAPTVPARWLQRLDAVLQAAGLVRDVQEERKYLSWVRRLDEHDETTPYIRPEPRPALDKRPKKLSVTKIEAWLKDPYSIYARSILGLKKLDPVDMQPGPAERGTLLHNILERFVTQYPGDVPPEAGNALISIAKEELEKLHDDPALWNFWWPRFHNLGDWLIAHEKDWRSQAKPLKTEVNGEAAFGGFTLSARADRIDKLSDGSMVVIDYKSGGTYTQSGIRTGDLPQLSLEAAILMAGGFESIPSGDVSALSYWTLTGGHKGGAITQVTDDIEDIVTRAREGLQKLIEIFNDPDMPYYSLPNPARAPRFNDYEHLARVKEWSALESNKEEAA